MATTSEILELIYRVTGTAEAAKLEDQLVRSAQKSDEARIALDALNAAYASGKGNSSTYADDKKKLEAVIDSEIDAHAKLIDTLEREAAAQDKAAARALAAAETKAQAAAKKSVQADTSQADAAQVAANAQTEAANKAADAQIAAANRTAAAQIAAASKAAAAQVAAAAQAAGPPAKAAQAQIDAANKIADADEKAAKKAEDAYTRANAQAIKSATKAAAAQTAAALATSDAQVAAANKAATAQTAASAQATVAARAASAAQIAASVQAATAANNAVASQTAAANKAATVQAATAEKTAKKIGTDAQQRIQGLGYALNDFLSVSGDMSQRLNAIANNMPMLLAGFGGLGLALSAIVPIIGLIIKNWGALKEMFTGVADAWNHSVEGMKEKLAELEKKKIKVGVDLLEIETLKTQIKAVEDAIRAVEALKAHQTVEEKKSGEGVKAATEKTIDETGKQISGPEVEKKLRAAKLQEKLPLDDAFQQADKKAEELRQQVEENNRLGIFLEKEAGPGAGAQAFENAEAAEKKRIKAIKEREDRRTKLDEEAGQAVGADMHAQEKESGAAQKAAQGRMAALARRAGLDRMADDIEALGVEEVKRADRFNVAHEQDLAKKKAQQIERDRLSAENERVGTAELETAEKAQKIILDRMRQKNEITVEAQRLQVDAKARGLSDVDAYEEVWRGVYAFLRGRLKDSKVLSSGEQVTATAKQAAGQAPAAGDQTTAEVTKAFGDKLAPQLQQRASAAAMKGKTPAEVQAMLQAAAAKMLGAGGVEGATQTEAAQKIADDQMQAFQARLVAAQANLAPAQRGDKRSPRARAVAEVAAEDRRKMQADQAKRQTDAFTEATAQNVFANPQLSGGVQFTPDQARSVAHRAVANVAKEGNLTTPEAQMAALQQAIEAELEEMRQAFGLAQTENRQAQAPRKRGGGGMRSIPVALSSEDRGPVGAPGLSGPVGMAGPGPMGPMGPVGPAGPVAIGQAQSVTDVGDSEPMPMPVPQGPMGVGRGFAAIAPAPQPRERRNGPAPAGPMAMMPQSGAGGDGAGLASVMNQAIDLHMKTLGSVSQVTAAVGILTSRLAMLSHSVNQVHMGSGQAMRGCEQLTISALNTGDPVG